MVIEPEVRLVQEVEFIVPPGFIGSRTGDFLPAGCETVTFELPDCSEPIWETKAEFELSSVSTLLSRLLIFSDRSESWVFWVTGA